MRRGSWAIAVLALTLLASGCSDDEPSDSTSSATTGPRPVSNDEADRLAVTRFNNYKRDLVPFELEVPTSAGDLLAVTGRADFREHRAVGAGVASDPAAFAVFAWNLAVVGVVDVETPADDAALSNAGTVPKDAWDVHALTSDEPLDTVFQVLLNLAFDRPENAQLLRQNGAQWLGSTTVNGTDVDLMSATPEGQGRTLTYYVDEVGMLVRVDVDLGGAQPATITFLDGTAAAVPVVKALGPTPDDEPTGTPG